MKAVTRQYPAIEWMGRNGLPVEDIPAYLGFAEVAELWDVVPSSIRTYLSDCVRLGEWRYLPKPDIMLVRDDNSVLPGWLPKTIANFQRLETVQGRGNHTRGEDRSGYTGGAFTSAYRHLGVTNAEKIRQDYADGVPVSTLAPRWGLRVKEVIRILDGKRWMPGSGKSRGAMDSEHMSNLGIERADEIRLLAKEGRTIDELVLDYGIRDDEVDDILSGSRWIRGSKVLGKKEVSVG